MTAFVDRYEEIVLVDFEFNGKEGNRPNVVCVVAHELKSGRWFRLRQDQLGSEPPYRIDNRTLVVAYYASAELMCHLVETWPLPANILDLFIEFRRLTNNSSEKQPPARLLDALDFFKLDSIGITSKEHWRDVILRGGPWSEEEWEGILGYCESDVIALEKLLRVTPISNWGHSLIHGSYMRADAWMRHRGVWGPWHNVARKWRNSASSKERLISSRPLTLPLAMMGEIAACYRPSDQRLDAISRPTLNSCSELTRRFGR